MPRFWLDADTLIQSKNGPYGFDIAPGFWAFLDEKASEGLMATSTMVYDELVEHSDDELAAWARQRQRSGLFVEPDQIVQEHARKVIDYVQSAYEASQAAKFLKGADPWIIGHAMGDHGQVVTMEVAVPSNSKKVKIPNICSMFQVDCVALVSMCRDLGLRLS